MAQLTDTLVSGDERVTGMIYGTHAGNYATCSSGASAVKTVTIPGFVLTTGVHVRIKFTNTNTLAVASLTLNVSDTGAKAIKVKGNNLAAAGDLAANGVYEFVYDGTNWELTGAVPTSHTHGNISNTGTLTDTAASAAGNDYVVIRDADNAKIQTSTIKGTDVADAVSKKHSHTSITVTKTATQYDGSHTLKLPDSDPYSSARTPTSHADANGAYGKATTANYGHVQLATGDMNGAANVDGVAVSKNHTHSQYLPKAGGTMTGGITLPTNFYHKDSKFGIDAKNSDIINANSIYFGDEATSSEEGIHFKRGDSGNTDNYDSFWIDNGKICFSPNHAVSTDTPSSSAQIVPRLPNSVSDNQVVLTNGTTGALKTLAASSLSVGTATTATSANITRTADTTNGDKLQIGSGTAVNVVNSQSTLNVAASSAATNTNARHIWFSDSSTETKRAYSDDLTYRADYNRITADISGYATGLTNQRDIQHQQAATSYPVHRIASYPPPNITTQGRNADNSLVLHLFTRGHNASDYGIVLITVKLASTVSDNPTVNVRWKLRSSGMPTDAVQAAFIKDASGLWHVDVFFIVQHQYQLTVFNKLGSFSALDGSPNGGWVLYSSNVDISYADGKECYTDISGDSADTASKRLYNSIGYDGAATGITDDGIVGAASKLSSYGGGPKQPVYFPSTGVNAGKPVAMDTVSHDNETYLDMNVERAYSAVAANSANTAGGLSLSSAVGSGTRPVYFNAQGAPLPIDYTNEEYLGNPVLNLTVTKARNALYVNGYSLAVGSYGGVSNRIYFC